MVDSWIKQKIMEKKNKKQIYCAGGRLKWVMDFGRESSR